MSLESFSGSRPKGRVPGGAEQYHEQMREAARAIKNMSANQAAQKRKKTIGAAHC